jgi:hypothetical protein
MKKEKNNNNRKEEGQITLSRRSIKRAKEKDNTVAHRSVAKR